MRRLAVVFLIAGAATASANDPVSQCLSCHVTEEGVLDIVGIRPLTALPSEWPFLFEDAFDLDDDGVAGAMRFVSTDMGPMSAKYGRSLAAARFEDFALIAAAAHDIDLSNPVTMAKVRSAFETLSPAPHFPQAETVQQLEVAGCTGCHVTETFDYEGVTYMPLSDFLLHDLGDGLRRTAPLWGCPGCYTEAPHPLP